MAEISMDYRKKVQMVRTVLLEEWDPIGVRGEPGAQDEYDRYLSTLIGMLERHANAEEVARYLGDVTTTEMGLVGVERRDREVAKSLVQLRFS